MKTILCYGDSNTFGYIPETGLRYDVKTRWPRVLAELLGGGYHVVEEGLNGRTALGKEPMEGWKNGSYALYPVLNSHKPVDLLLIMLGSNDLKKRFALSADRIAEGAAALGRRGQRFLQIKQGYAPRVLLVSPPVLDPCVQVGPFGDEFDASSVETSKQLAAAYEAVCRKNGFAFVNGADLAVSDPADGLHLSAESHRCLAEGLCEAVRGCFGQALGSFYFGIDVGGTTVKFGLFDGQGTLVQKAFIPTRTGKEPLFGDIALQVRRMAQQHGISLDCCRAGMGIAGPVDNHGYMETGTNLGLSDMIPPKELSALLDGMPVWACNDANAAALGEQWKGGGRGFDDIAFITLGTGVGAGLICEGRLLHGVHGLCGEIGHIHVDDDLQLACNCGSRGCLEQIASASGLVRCTKEQLLKRAEPSVLRGCSELTAKDILDAARAGDALADGVVRACMQPLGLVLSQIHYITDPQAVVIGGGMSLAGPYLLQIIEEQFLKYPKLRSVYPVFRLAELGSDAGIYGAAKLAMDGDGQGNVIF